MIMVSEIRDRLIELLVDEKLILCRLSSRFDEGIFKMVISNRYLDCLKVTVIDGKAFRFEGNGTRDEIEYIDYVIDKLCSEFPVLCDAESEEISEC